MIVSQNGRCLNLNKELHFDRKIAKKYDGESKMPLNDEYVSYPSLYKL